VLGLIFEKINGYKDGSFFTPGFITMYMCCETIRKAVIQKFSEVKKWNCQTIEDLKEDMADFIKKHPKGRKEARKEANQIVNSLKICDPAVGSGHFLVSALNEIIAIKNDLSILEDRAGESLNSYEITTENDELVILNDNAQLFKYLPNSKESQRVQETLFHEKQTIIENCLFGVDINPNSVKICRLRLWIELLKNAYYSPESNFTELQTLPNIDINIKCGNSLISRFALDADLSQILKKSKWSIESYQIAVDTYRNPENREEKREMERLIAHIKTDFRTEIAKNDYRMKRISKLKGELDNLTDQSKLFELSKKEQAEKQEREKDLALKNIELTAQQKQNLYLGAFIFLLLCGLGVLIYFYQTMRKQKNIISQQNQLNEHTISILSHDIKEPLLGVKLLLKKLHVNDPFLAQASLSLENQINANNGVQIPLGRIELSVSVKKTTNANFEISYLVSNAGWSPNYDFRIKDAIFEMSFLFLFKNRKFF
jgi:hypothetical protein